MEQRRAGEKEGRKLSPGERAKNWAGAAVTLWPVLAALLGVLGYTNKEKLGISMLAQPDGVTEIESQNFQQQVQKFSRETVEKLNRIELRMDRIESERQSKDGDLQSQIKELEAKIKYWHE